MLRGRLLSNAGADSNEVAGPERPGASGQQEDPVVLPQDSEQLEEEHDRDAARARRYIEPHPARRRLACHRAAIQMPDQEQIEREEQPHVLVVAGAVQVRGDPERNLDQAEHAADHTEPGQREPERPSQAKWYRRGPSAYAASRISSAVDSVISTLRWKPTYGQRAGPALRCGLCAG